MPLTHDRTFRVRHSECDIHGIVRDASYLRYMEATAFDASAAAGFDQPRYMALGRMWLIRETWIEYLGALRMGDAAVVTTWVADFRRVRSRRAYTVRHAATGDLVARAHTDWAFIDLATGRPAVIPADLIAAFFPEGLPDQPEPRERFPAAQPPEQGALTYQRHVDWRDLDTAGHVNNAVYLDYVEDAARRHCADCGWPLDRLAAEGVDLATCYHRMEYRQPALPQDQLDVSTWGLTIGGADSGLRHTTIKRVSDGELLAQAHTAWRCVNASTRAALPPTLAHTGFDTAAPLENHPGGTQPTGLPL
jgi:acyl-CoA thioester hydrolase